jgi:hypothetical protein
MKRIGFFKRIGKPTRLGNVSVNTGDVIKADFDFIMEQLEGGWLYIDPKKQQIPQRSQQPMQPQQLPQQRYDTTIIKTDDNLQLNDEEIDSIKTVTNLYESIEQGRKEEMEKANPTPAPLEVNIDKLRELKKLTNKEWFSVTKEQSIKLLTEANIDFSHVPKTKWELVKFIKGIIKDL